MAVVVLALFYYYWRCFYSNFVRRAVYRMLRGEHAAGPRRRRRRHRFSSSAVYLGSYTHTNTHTYIMYTIHIRHSGKILFFLPMRFGVVCIYLYRRSRIIILMCAVFIIIIIIFNEHISPTTYPEKGKKIITDSHVDQPCRFPVRDILYTPNKRVLLHY